MNDEILTSACRMEWIKLRTLRSTWWLLAFFAVVMIGLGIMLLSVLLPGIMPPSAQTDFDAVNRASAGIFIGEIIAGIFGVLACTGEYSSGMIRATLTAVNDRPRAFGGKVLVVGSATLVTSVAISFATFWAGEAVLRPSLPHESIGQPDVLRAVVLGAVYLFLVTMIGLGLGALLRNAAPAIGVLVGVLFALPLIVAQLPHSESIVKFLPTSIAADSLTAAKPEPNALMPWAGLLLMCLYALVTLAAGYWSFSRRDA